jgi:hypothetical protein
MADESHLNELVSQEAEPIARSLLEEFAKLVRDLDVGVAEYPARLRQVMDGLFKGIVNASGQSDSS